jgi:hypothetical protein
MLLKTPNKYHKMSDYENTAFKTDNLIIYKLRFPLYTECSAGERTAISWTDRVKNEALHSQERKEHPTYNNTK